MGRHQTATRKKQMRGRQRRAQGNTHVKVYTIATHERCVHSVRGGGEKGKAGMGCKRDTAQQLGKHTHLMGVPHCALLDSSDYVYGRPTDGALLTLYQMYCMRFQSDSGG